MRRLNDDRREVETMSERYKGVLVAFESTIRDDDAQAIISAIKQIRGVAAVTPSVDDSDDWMNRSMIRLELRKAIFAALETTEK